MGDKGLKFLNNVLSDEEMRQLSSHVLNKLETHLERSQLSFDVLKNEMANNGITAEKKTFNIERDLQNTRIKLNMTEDFSEKLKNQLKETEEALQKSRHDYYEILQCKESMSFEVNSLRERVDRFSTEKLDMTELLERRVEEITGLQTELKSLSSRLMSNSKDKIETTIKAEEIELRVLSLQHQDMRMTRERDLYQKQISALNEELNQKISELLSLRRERAVQVLELQSNLEQKTEQHSKAFEEIKHLKNVIDKKDKHIDSLAARIREMQHFSTQMEEDFQNEITALHNLIESHKNSSQEFKKRNESLVETIGDLQKLLETAKAAHNELEVTFNETQIKFSEQLEKSFEETNSLVKEINELRANNSRENIEAEFEKQYPLAATTKKLIRNNMSFTQVFNELTRAQQELEECKNENLILKEHIQQLASEAEDNAPLLHREMHEHQRAMQTISEFRNRFVSMDTEKEQLLLERDTLNRMIKQFEREMKRYESENTNLAKQVRALVRSVHEARGFTVANPRDSETSDAKEDSLTFNDIFELQAKNQQLINELHEEREKIRVLESEQKDVHYKELEEAQQMIENLRKERIQQAELVEALVKQKEIPYKLIESHISENCQTPVSANRIDIEVHNELKSNFDNITKEYEEFRESSSKRIQNLNENNERLKNEVSSYKIDISKTSSELAFINERLEIYKTNMEQFQRENATLRERNTVLTESVKKHEKTIVLMRQDLIGVQEKLNRLEVTHESLKSERDLYKNNELKLLQEKELLVLNQENQNRLINNLQAVQENISRMENDAMKNLKSLNEKLEKECEYFKKKYEKERERDSSVELNKLSIELEALKSNRKQLEKQIQNLKSELELKNAEIVKLESEMTSIRSDSVQTQNTIVQLRKVARKYKTQYDELKVEFDKLKENETKSAVNTIEFNDKILEHESHSKELTQRVEDLTNKVLEQNQRFDKMNKDFVVVNEEKEAAKAQAVEKEEKAKKIAHQAKQRLAALNTEKMNLLREKESVEKCVEELREQIKILEQNAEESSLRMASIKSVYDSKMGKQERELSEAHKQIEEFKDKLQSNQQFLQSQQKLQQQTPTAIAVTAPVLSSSQSSSAPVRHSVHPQQSSLAKSTPTASIRPLAVAPTHVHRTPRTATVSQSRTATVATVQPTTEEPTSHQTVPHATVQPTQTVSSQMIFVTPTSTSDTETIMAQNDSDSFDEMNSRESNNLLNQRTVEQLTENSELSGSFPEPTSSTITNESEHNAREDVPQLSSTSQRKQDEAEPSTSTSTQIEKITLKRVRKPSEELISSSPKKIRVESESEETKPQSETIQSDQEISDKLSDNTVQPSQQPIESAVSMNEDLENKNTEIVTQSADDNEEEIIILESDESEDEQRVESEQEEEEDDDEEEEFDDEEEENVDEVSEEVYDNEEYNEEMSEGSHYEEEVNDEQSEDEREDEEEVEIIGDSNYIPDQNRELVSDSTATQSIRTEQISSEQIDPIVSTTVPSLQVTSIVTSSTESNPFIQIPTPIQRPFTSGRQSFYMNQQSSSAYDEGDGIVPSTPTLFVPRRGDSFTDALNSPRVPQGRFVFSSSMPEASALSQLASEGTLGVDDTRMDLTQFDDNGRSVPTTPLANSPAIDSGVQSNSQNVSSDQDSNQAYAIDPNQVSETPISTQFDSENNETSGVNINTDIDECNQDLVNESETEIAVDVIDSNISADDDVIEQLDNESEPQIEEEVKEVAELKTVDNDNTCEPNIDNVPSTSSTTNSGQKHVQTARRGRGFQGRVIQRQPIVWPTESSGAVNRPSNPNVSQVQANPEVSQQAGRRIRLRGASTKFSTRGDFRGGRGPGRGGRGGFHYN